MNYDQFLVWNARGLNSRARRTAVKDIIVLEHVSVVCLQETKVAAFSQNMLNELMGTDFDYSFLPSMGVASGVLIGWRRDLWRGSSHSVGAHSVSMHLDRVDPAIGEAC
jgi:exonuclease III